MNLHYLALFVISSLTVFANGGPPSDCKFPSHLSQRSKKGEAQIEVLKGQRYTVSDKDYIYDIGICVSATDPPPQGTTDWDDVAVMQINKTNKAMVKAIGRFSEADIMAGPDWVMLEYNKGEPYGTHCKGEERRARIIFICDESAVDEVVTVLEEQNNKTDACYYLFEINTVAVCKKQPFITVGLSVGSILLIVFFTLVGVYILGGCLYNRLVLQAKGLEQFPNIEFWRDFGNLQADGCDLICRSRKSRQPRTYKGIGDDQLGESDTPNTDEHLLPM